MLLFHHTEKEDRTTLETKVLSFLLEETATFKEVKAL
jgi:hypothetical protein